MSYIRKLEKIPYGNCRVAILDNDVVELISYETKVAVLDRRTGWLYVNGLYSATTRKHLSAFMAEYCGCDYRVAKRCATTGEWYNIFDREFLKAV